MPFFFGPYVLRVLLCTTCSKTLHGHIKAYASETGRRSGEPTSAEPQFLHSPVRELPLAVPLPVEPREELPSDPVSHWIRKAGCAPESAEFADAIRECPVLQRSDLQFAVKRVAFTSDRRARLAIGAPPGKCVKLVFRRAQGRPLASQGDCVPGLLSPRPTSGK